MAKIGIEATKAQLEKAVEVTDGSILTGENSVALKGTASGYSSVAIRGTASGEKSTAINANASGDYSVSIGGATTNDNSVGIGFVAKATGAQSIAIGLFAKATEARAIQLGEGTNNNGNTVQFGDYQILDANGKIPDERMKATIDGTTKTVLAWLIQALQAKPIQSIGLVGGKIRITYTDNTYVESGDISATQSAKGIVQFASESDMDDRTEGKALEASEIDYIVGQALTAQTYSFDTNTKKGIAYWLTLAYDEVLFGEDYLTVQEAITELYNEVMGATAIVEDIEEVIGE